MGEILAPRTPFYCRFIGEKCTCVGCRFFNIDDLKCTNIEELVESTKATLDTFDTEWFDRVAQCTTEELATALVDVMRKQDL